MSFSKRAAAGIRDAWLMVGICVLIIIGAELLYRSQSAIQRRFRSSADSPSHPYTDSSWFAPYMEEHRLSHRLEWRPYVYFRRRPFSGTYVNIDSSGRRVTAQAHPFNGRELDVFLFGGSTMFGSFQRDANTIPSVTARALAARGLTDIVLTNFGETGYVMSQSVFELILQLRSGARPKVVVFYDGINDVAALLQNGRPGLPQNEENRAREFELGRAVFAWDHDVVTETRAIVHAGSLAVGRLRWLNRVRRRRPASKMEQLDETAVSAFVANYVGTARAVEALAAEFGFRPLYVWQPVLHGNTKLLTSFESSLSEQISKNPFQSVLRELHVLLPHRLEEAMAPIAPGRFMNLSALFAGDTSSVFVDVIGHTTEGANASLANVLAPAIGRLLRDSRGVSVR